MSMKSLFQNMALKNLTINWAKAHGIDLDSFCLQLKQEAIHNLPNR
jgi:hypothetical protein